MSVIQQTQSVGIPREIRLVFDRLPISKANGYKYSPRSNRVYVTKACKTWQTEVQEALAPYVADSLGIFFPPEQPVEVEIVFSYQDRNKDGSLRKRMPDTDGPAKAILDAAQAAGLLFNDRQVSDVVQRRRAAPVERTIVIFRDAPFGVPRIVYLPSIRRGEFEEERRARLISGELPGQGEDAARCWSCDILIGSHRIEREIWLFVGSYKKDVAGALTCRACSEALKLTPNLRLFSATDLLAIPPTDRRKAITVRAAEATGSPIKILQGREARDLIRRLRPS